jgi:hypothetical protein
MTLPSPPPASRERAETVVREKQKAEPKLSVKPPGWWQNKFRSETDAVFQNGEAHKAGEWFSPNRHPSRDVAETRAQHHLIEFAGWCAKHGVVYLGPVFFAEGDTP